MTQLKSLKSLLLTATLGLTALTSANLYAHDTHSHAANKALEKAVAGEHRSAKNKANPTIQKKEVLDWLNRNIK